MADVHEVVTPPDGRPPGPRRVRVLVLVLACVAVAALVATLVVSLRGTTGPSGAPVSIPPNQRSDTEAAVRNGWTMTAHDEFDGDAVDEDHWELYKGKTTDDVGQHDPDNVTVSDGTLKINSRGDTSAGLAWTDGQRYGRWEARVRSQKGDGYGPVLLLWPDAEDWPEGGEIDMLEIPEGDRSRAHFTVHWGSKNNQDAKTVTGDFTQWHTVAVEWTADHIIGYVDGQQIYRTDNADAIPPRSMHFAMQQDIGPYGDGWMPARDASTPQPCTFEVDWVRIYAA